MAMRVRARQTPQCGRVGDDRIFIVRSRAVDAYDATIGWAGSHALAWSARSGRARSRTVGRGPGTPDGRAFAAHRNRNAFGFRPQRRVPVDRRPPARRVRRGRQRQRRVAGQPALREQPRHGGGHVQRRLWTRRPDAGRLACKPWPEIRLRLRWGGGGEL